MRRLCVALLVMTMSTTAAHAQDALTSGQRVADLNQLASFYAKNYAPYEWKRDTIGFDLLNLKPWLRRIQQADDLDFQEVLIDYVASLNDAHDYIAFPTTFSASLGLSVDIYDGKVLIDAINRAALPVDQYPFTIGDELLWVNGRPVKEVMRSLRKYAIAANPGSTNRTAASRIVSRSQQIMPHIPELGDAANLIIRQASSGAERLYSLPWTKIGIPVTSQGPVPSPRSWRPAPLTEAFRGAESTFAAAAAAPSMFRSGDVPVTDNTLPAYMQPVTPLLNAAVLLLRAELRREISDLRTAPRIRDAPRRGGH
jgi:PDZ domain-containing protein